MNFKIILLFLFIFMASGFRLLTSAKWKITPASPTLWVKLCSNYTGKFIDDNDLPTSDPLTGGQLSIANAMKSIRDDYNKINSSFIRLAEYPADPSNPPAAETGDDTFTIALAQNRTIEVCYVTPSNPFQGGEAKPTITGDTITGCKITMSSKSSKKAKDFISTMTHELGHCLGLFHPQETKNAIMSYHRSQDQFRLMIDDKMGLIFQYPKDGIDTKESSTFGLSCSKRE